MKERNQVALTKEVRENIQRAEMLREIMPRNQCRHYIGAREAVLLTKKAFDELYYAGAFAEGEGPHKDNFGSGYGEPYNPDRQAFGTLKDGRIVYCEISSKMQEKVKKYLDSLV